MNPGWGGDYDDEAIGTEEVQEQEDEDSSDGDEPEPDAESGESTNDEGYTVDYDLNASDEDEDFDYENKYEEIESMRGSEDPSYAVYFCAYMSIMHEHRIEVTQEDKTVDYTYAENTDIPELPSIAIEQIADKVQEDYTAYMGYRPNKLRSQKR